MKIGLCSVSFRKLSVDEIIALADVGKGTVYKYYGNKEQLFYKLIQLKNILRTNNFINWNSNNFKASRFSL